MRLLLLLAVIGLFTTGCAENKIDDGNSQYPNNRPQEEVDNPNAVIYYTTTDGKRLFPKNHEFEVFNAMVVSNSYDDGIGVLTFDGEVTLIGNGAFYNCTTLKTIDIPDSVTAIGQTAFAGCENLQNTTIPSNVTSIGLGAFAMCNSITSVDIPDAVVTIDPAAFAYCSNIERFSGKFATSDGNCLIFDKSLIAFAPAGLSEYHIPDGIRSIGAYAFANCTNLKHITIPESTIGIGPDSFSDCIGLESITIPKNVYYISESAFYNCRNIHKMYCDPIIPPSYSEASGLGRFAEDMVIYVYEESIDLYKDNDLNYAVYPIMSNGKSLGSLQTTIYYTNIDGRVKPISGIPIKSHTYGEIVVYGTLPAIPERLFEEYDSLESIVIPDTVYAILHNAFWGCDNLQSIIIPNSVIYISDAFGECDNLLSIYCAPTTPPEISYTALSSIANGCKIYVPTESVNAYKSAEIWKYYADHIVGYDF